MQRISQLGSQPGAWLAYCHTAITTMSVYGTVESVPNAALGLGLGAGLGLGLSQMGMGWGWGWG